MRAEVISKVESSEQEVSDITKEHVLITTAQAKTEDGGIHYTVYLDNEIDNPAKYRNFVEFLDKSSENDEFTLKLNGPGGNLYTCAQLVHAIQSTEATVIGELVGEVCSAHSNIFIACHKHIVHPYSAMMVHTLSGGAWGKGEDIIRMGTASNDIVKLMYTDLYEGFLTAKELEDVLTNNKDLWYIGGEVITARLEGLHVLRDEAMEEVNAVYLREAQDELIAAAEEIKEQRRELGDAIVTPTVDLSTVAHGDSTNCKGRP